MLQDEQFMVDQDLAKAVLAQVPRGWHMVTLRAQHPSGGSGADSYRLSLETAVGVPGAMVADEPLQLAVRKLFLLHRRYNTGMTGATYLFRQRPDGRWSWNAEYNYGG